MALLGLKIPEDVSRLLRNLDVPGDRDNSDHLTMFYFEDDILKPKVVSELCLAVSKAVMDVKPFVVAIDKISCFPKGKNGVPIKADVKSKELSELREELANVLDKNDIEFSKKFTDFNPHITLAYGKEEISDIEIIIPIEWTVSSLILWGGESGNNGMNMEFNLSGKITNASSIFKMTSDYYNLVRN